MEIKICKLCKINSLDRKNRNKFGMCRICVNKIMKLGNKNPQWKGNKVKYRSLHQWIVNNYGKANKCSNHDCKIKKPKKFHWANISGKYRREITDYRPLCASCHLKSHYKDGTHSRLSHLKRKRDKYGRFIGDTSKHKAR